MVCPETPGKGAKMMMEEERGVSAQGFPDRGADVWPSTRDNFQTPDLRHPGPSSQDDICLVTDESMTN